MRFLLPLLLVGALLPVTAAPVTPNEARAMVAEARGLLVQLNQSVVDAHFHQGQFRDAITVLDRIIALDPQWVEPYANAAWLAWSSGDKPLALEYYRRLVAANPQDPRGYFEVGFFHLRQNELADAERWLKQAVEHGLPSPQRHAYGHTLVRLGRTAEALAFWQQVLKEEPHNAVAQQEIGKLTESAPNE